MINQVLILCGDEKRFDEIQQTARATLMMADRMSIDKGVVKSIKLADNCKYKGIVIQENENDFVIYHKEEKLLKFLATGYIIRVMEDKNA